MCEMGNTGHSLAGHEKDRDAAENKRSVASPDWYEKEEKQSDIRKLQPKRKNKTQNGTRCPNGGDYHTGGIAEKQPTAQVPDKGYDSGAHACEEIEGQKVVLAPALFKRPSKQEKRIHIEEEVQETPMEKHIAEDLPDPTETDNDNGNEAEYGGEQPVTPEHLGKNGIALFREG